MEHIKESQVRRYRDYQPSSYKPHKNLILTSFSLSVMFSKSFATLATLAFATLSVASATPAKRQDATKSTCYFIMTPSPDLGAENLEASINYAIGHTVGQHYPNTPLRDDNTLFRHNDGTYDVTSIITVDGVAPADVNAFVNGWDEQTLDGLAVEWKVNAVNCS
jgi:hypothetical protein